MKYECFENETYNLYTILTDKFKSVHMEVVFKTPTTKETITYLSLLGEILSENSLKYPSKKLFMRKSLDLYNANIYATTSRVGGLLLTNFCLDFLDPKYTDSQTKDESIELLFDMILNPNARDGEFDEATFERIKNRVAIAIDAIKEDPKQSSILDAFKALSKDDVRSININGDSSILESITPRKLYKFYQEFLEKSPRDIYIIGNTDMKEINRIVRRFAKFKSITSIDESVYLPEYNISKALSVANQSELTQTNLVQIYSLKSLTEYERDYCLPLYNMIFGSGSLESKLYKKLRGENSLCYNVTSFYQKYDKNLIIHTAIDEANVKKTLKLIKEALTEMNKGKVTEEELENVKNLLITSLHLIFDSPNRLIDMYVFKNIVGLADIEERIDEFKKVSLKDLNLLAKKIKLVMTYRLKGE